MSVIGTMCFTAIMSAIVWTLVGWQLTVAVAVIDACAICVLAREGNRRSP